MDIPFVNNVFEGLFAFIVVALFIFFIFAKVKKKKPLELYNETMDKIFGLGNEDIKSPLSGMKKLNFRNKTLR